MDQNLYVFGFRKSGFEIKIFEVDCHEFGARGTEDAVEEEFGGD